MTYKAQRKDQIELIVRHKAFEQAARIAACTHTQGEHVTINTNPDL